MPGDTTLAERVDMPGAPRAECEVAQRILALIYVSKRAAFPDDARVQEWAREHGVGEYLSAQEREFVEMPILPDRLRVKFSWRVEALVPLIWALGELPSMPRLDEEFDVASSNLLRSAFDNPKKFLASVKLRSESEIKDAEADHYDFHWEVVDAQINGKPVPAGLNYDIVYERRYALSWLVGWGTDWDSVPTDT